MIYKTLIMLSIVNILLLGCASTTSLSTNYAPDINSLCGSIIINVDKPTDWQPKYVVKGFSINFPEIKMKEEYKEELEISENFFVIPKNSKYNTFVNTFKKEREYWAEMNDEIEQVFSEYDLLSLDNLFHLSKERCSPNYGRGLVKEFLLDKFPSGRFIPNRQLSYSIYRPKKIQYTAPTKGEGILINAHSKGISYPFGCDSVGIFEWSPDGQFIAYTDYDKKILIIMDIVKNETVFRKNICKRDESIHDITWEPNSKHLAVLTVEGRLGLLPWQLLTVITTDPSIYYSYYLEIYNLDGEKIYYDKIGNGELRADASFVWTDR
jgi:hypothetical protein